MNEHSRPELDTYYAEAASWNRDRVRAMHRSQRVAWGLAIGAGAIAALEALALILLLPLKTVVPYTLMVDSTTGYVQALEPGKTPKVSSDSALTQSFLAQYVGAREGFDAAIMRGQYRKVALFSSDRARSAYLDMMQPANPANPFNLYPRSSIVTTRVKSVSPIATGAAMVRFDTQRQDINGTVRPPEPWIAVVRFRYSNAPMSLDDRLVNPLGFEVTGYRKDRETPPPIEAGPGTGVAAQQRDGQPMPYYPQGRAPAGSNGSTR